MPHLLQRAQFVPAPIDDVFAFFRDPQNLGVITPDWLGFRIEDAPDGNVFAGCEIGYTIRLFGAPMRWRTRIPVYEDGVRFIDEQASGPYKSWVHEHRFTPLLEGTLVTDRVEYEMPFGPLGAIARVVAVRHQLRAIFDYRARVMRERFGAFEQ
jgi:ligand-binding SRPBCC domain-containing protein